MAQHDSSRLNFPTLITALCKARGVHSDSLTHERLSPTINLAYIKKNCWNLDDLSVTFRGQRKAKGKRSEAPPSSESIHRGQSIIMQSLQGLGLPSIMGMEEFNAQEPNIEEPPAPAPTEEETTLEQTLQPSSSSAPAPEETQPSTLVVEPEQLI
ncbi:hypothetical protein HKD37_10G028666 [Glycine soja]